MRVVPKNDGPRIAFYSGRIERWLEHADQMGSSPELVTQLQALTEEARQAYAAHARARSAARSAKLRLKLAIAKMHRAGSSIILLARARAQTSGSSGSSVYALASIPTPKKRAPIGPPGKLEKVSFKLHQTGSLELRWKCKNPRGSAGTAYWVWRRVGPNGAFECLGGTGKKHFIDRTLPAGAGAGEVTYRIRAVRAGKPGPWAQLPVNFGTTGDGPTSAVPDKYVFGPPVPLAA